MPFTNPSPAVHTKRGLRQALGLGFVLMLLLATAVAATSPATLNISMTANKNPAEVEADFNYTITVTNTGGADAQNVQVKDTLPADLTLTSSSASQGSCAYDAGTNGVTCDVGTMSSGNFVTVMLTVKPHQETTLNNTATVITTSATAGGNDTASVNGLPALKFTDLATAMTLSAASLFTGQSETYTITVSNLSQTTSATGVALTDSLPASMTFVSATTSQGSLVTPPVGSNGIVTANLGTIGAGASATVTITANTTSPGTITNSATANGTENDGDGNNNTASKDVVVTTAELSSIALAAQALVGGCENTTGNVYLNGPAPPGGLTINLSTSNLPGVTVPASVFIPAGQAVSPAFNVTTSPLVGAFQGTVNATLNATAVSADLRVGDSTRSAALFTNGGAYAIGSSGTVTFTNRPNDPCGGTDPATFHYAYDFDNDGTFDDGDGTYVGSGTNSSVTVPASYLTPAGPHVVKGRIIDSQGSTDYTTTIDILPVFTISGYVRTNTLTPIAGVSVTRTGSATPVTTDASGFYLFTGVVPGLYTLTPSKSGYTFSPASQGLRVSSSDRGANFIGKANGVSVSGRVSDSSSVAISGVTVTADSGRSATTNSAGYYTLLGVPDGSRTLTPNKAGYLFTPTSKPVTISGSNVSGVNFIGSTGYTVTGRIATSSGIGISGVTVQLDSGPSALTNSAGYYTFTNVPNGSYTVTPTKSGYFFTPASKNVTVNGANLSGQNFIGSTGYTVSGRIATSSGIGVSGATVSIDNATSVTTNSAGYFTLYNVANGSHLLAPDKAGMTFFPSSRTIVVNSANLGGQNFTGSGP